MRQSVRTAGKLPEELSASVGVGRTRLAMMVDQLENKRGRVFSFFWIAAVWDVGTQAGIEKLSLLTFFDSRTVASPKGSLSRSVA